MNEEELFTNEVLAKLRDSPISVFLALGPDDPGVLGAAILLGMALICDTPLLVLVPPGFTISPQLRDAADEIVDDWTPDNPESQERTRAAMLRLGYVCKNFELVFDPHHKKGLLYFTASDRAGHASLAERWLDPHSEPPSVPYRGSGNVSAFHCSDCERKAIKAGRHRTTPGA